MPEPVKMLRWKILPAPGEQLVSRSLPGVLCDSTRLFVNKLCVGGKILKDGTFTVKDDCFEET